MSNNMNQLAEFMADIVLTSHYLGEPITVQNNLLHDSEVRALKLVYTYGPLSMQDLANRLHTSKARCSQLVNALMDYKMVERTKGGDKRFIYVVTTPKGKQMVRKIRAKYIRLAEIIENRLGKTDSAELIRLLEKISPLHNIALD